MFLYLQGVSVSVSVLTLSCISIERWYAICYPLKFKATPSRAKVMIIVIWTVSLCIIIPELVVLDTFSKFGHITIILTSCKPTWSYTSQAAYQLILSIAMYVLPFILMGVTYFQIARCLWSNTIPTETSKSSSQCRFSYIFDNCLRSVLTVVHNLLQKAHTKCKGNVLLFTSICTSM